MKNKDTILLEQAYSSIYNNKKVINELIELYPDETKEAQENTPQETNTQQPQGQGRNEVLEVIAKFKSLASQKGIKITTDEQGLLKIGQLLCNVINKLNEFVTKKDPNALRIENSLNQKTPDEFIRLISPFTKKKQVTQEGVVGDTFDTVLTKLKNTLGSIGNWTAYITQALYIIIIVGVGLGLGTLPILLLLYIIHQNPKVLKAVWFLPQGGELFKTDRLTKKEQQPKTQEKDFGL
jgi:hypothetical protein